MQLDLPKYLPKNLTSYVNAPKGKRAKSSIPWQVHLCLDYSNNGEPNSCYCGGTILDEKTILVLSMSFYPNLVPIVS